MDLALFARNRLKQLRLRPRNLARATRMTESYIVRLPKPNSGQTAAKRTDVHDQLERVLKLPQGHLAKLAPLSNEEPVPAPLRDGSSPSKERKCRS